MKRDNYLIPKPQGAPEIGYMESFERAGLKMGHVQATERGRWGGQGEGVVGMSVWREHLFYGHELGLSGENRDRIYVKLIGPKWKYITDKNGKQIKHKGYTQRKEHIAAMRSGSAAVLFLVTDRNNAAWTERADRESDQKVNVDQRVPIQYFICDHLLEGNGSAYGRLGHEFEDHADLAVFCADVRRDVIMAASTRLPVEPWERHIEARTAPKHGGEVVERQVMDDLQEDAVNADDQSPEQAVDEHGMTELERQAWEREIAEHIRTHQARTPNPNRLARVYLMVEKGDNARQMKVGISCDTDRRMTEFTQAIEWDLWAELTHPIPAYLAKRIEDRIHHHLKATWPHLNPTGNEFYLLQNEARDKVAGMINAENTKAMLAREAA